MNLGEFVTKWFILDMILVAAFNIAKAIERWRDGGEE